MTHDELTARLRAADHDTDEGWPAMVLAANRLDRYRELLDRAFVITEAKTTRQNDPNLLSEIAGAIK
jgi:hypothetical protein